jgi:hypothetical protein
MSIGSGIFFATAAPFYRFADGDFAAAPKIHKLMI